MALYKFRIIIIIIITNRVRAIVKKYMFLIFFFILTSIGKQATVRDRLLSYKMLNLEHDIYPNCCDHRKISIL